MRGECLAQAAIAGAAAAHRDERLAVRSLRLRGERNEDQEPEGDEKWGQTPFFSRILEMFPYLRVKDAAKATAFYCRAFGATEKFRLVEPSGRLGHAELAFGTAILRLSDEYPEHDLRGPAPWAPPR